MAIARDGTASGNTGVNSVASFNWSHTVTSNTNGVVVVGVSINVIHATTSVGTITYGATPMTFGTNRDAANTGVEYWYLTNPPTGANTVTVSFTGANGKGAATSISWTGVDQTVPIAAFALASGNSQNATVAAPTSAGNQVVISTVNKKDSTEAPASAQTQDALDVSTASASLNVYNGQSEAVSTTSPMNWTWSTNNRIWGIIAAVLNPSVIAFDHFSIMGTSGQAIGTLSHIIGTSPNPILFVGAGYDDGGAHYTGISYNGVNLTKIGTSVEVSNHGNELWFLKNPATGTHNILGTLSDASSAGQWLSGISYTGVDQVNPITGSVLSGNTTGTAKGTYTTINNAERIVGFVTQDGGNTMTAAPNTTSRGSEVTADGFGVFYFAGDYLSIMPAGLGTMGWNTTAGANINFVSASFRPASSAYAKLIQTAGTSNLALGSTSATWGANTTTGNLVLVGITVTNPLVLGTVTSVSDTQGNSYAKAVSGTLSEATSVIDAELWYGTNITGGAGSVTVQHGIDNAAVIIREYSGYNTLDITSSATGSSANPNTGTSSATANVNELLVVSTSDDKGATQKYGAAGSFGAMIGSTATLTGLSMEDQLLTVTGAQTGTLNFGSVANWISLAASFQNVAGTATSTFIGFNNLIGVGY